MKRDQAMEHAPATTPGEHVHTEAPAVYAPLHVRIATLLIVILPFLGLVASIATLWAYGFAWIHWAVLGVMYVLTGIGITVGYHRYFTHKSFETNRVLVFIIGVLGSMAVEGSIIKWVAVHRRHHQHSDRPEDPHSPHHAEGEGMWAMLKGLVRAHFGWFFEPDSPNLARYVPDLARDRLVRMLSRLFPLWATLGILIPALLGGLFTMSWSGALLGLVIGGLARIFLVHHVTWSINSVCHLWGTQPFRSHDHSRNNAVFGVLGFGEGWHNNHHAFPTSARHGLRWWEIDVSYLIIWALEKVGLVWAVRVPNRETIEAKKVTRTPRAAASRSRRP